MNSRILNGEESEAPKLMAAAQLLTTHVGILRNAVTQGNAVLVKVYAEEAKAQAAKAADGVTHTSEPPPEGIVPARAAASRN